MLGTTKRGLEEKVVITNIAVVSWLDFHVQWKQPGDRFLNISYHTVQYWLGEELAVVAVPRQLADGPECL